MGGGGVVVRPPTYSEDPSASVRRMVVLFVGASVVLETRFRPPPVRRVVSLVDLSSVAMRLRFDAVLSRDLEREGFLGELGLATSLIPNLQRNLYENFE